MPVKWRRHKAQDDDNPLDSESEEEKRRAERQRTPKQTQLVLYEKKVMVSRGGCDVLWAGG